MEKGCVKTPKRPNVAFKTIFKIFTFTVYFTELFSPNFYSLFKKQVSGKAGRAGNPCVYIITISLQGHVPHCVPRLHTRTHTWATSSLPCLVSSHLQNLKLSRSAGHYKHLQACSALAISSTVRTNPLVACLVWLPPPSPATLLYLVSHPHGLPHLFVWLHNT